jgi:hypothetical protein
MPIVTKFLGWRGTLLAKGFYNAQWKITLHIQVRNEVPRLLVSTFNPVLCEYGHVHRKLD